MILFASRQALAHKPSDAHLQLTVDGNRVEGRLDVAVRDLDGALQLDTDGDGAITWAELSAATPRIDRYIADRLAFATNGSPCVLTLGATALVDLSDGPYWAQSLTSQCPASARTLSITYRLLFDLDAQHRGLVHLEGAKGRALIIRDGTPVTVEAGEGTSISEFIEEGVWHIWHGLDHILFLTALILPAVAVARRQRGRSSRFATTPRDSLRAVVVEVFEIVTAFTLAHSLTLVISAVGLVRLPSRFVETAIALSVVAAAANNLVRLVDARWAVAFALGLLHGFGFSSVLVDLGLPSHELIAALLGFNLGVELGQVAFVLLLLPLLFAMRRTLVYRIVLWGGSSAIVVLASVWSYQRCFP